MSSSAEYIENVRLCGTVHVTYVAIQVAGHTHTGVVAEIHSCFHKKVTEVNVIQLKHIISIVVHSDARQLLEVVLVHIHVVCPEKYHRTCTVFFFNNHINDRARQYDKYCHVLSYSLSGLKKHVKYFY